jgi:NO-binding membrane sensor protein with MHYT domain
MLEFSHNGWLVLASLAVALMAGFTGLSLTKGVSAVSPSQRKLVIVMAAIALGGGIWSMHFIAMLGLQLPVLFYYDALVTLISALMAILMVGLALLILHYLPRGPVSIVTAGAIVGLGIVVMHFIGMYGMELCRPVNNVGDYLLSGAAAVVLSVLAIWVAYDSRTNRNILLGTVCFGAAVVTVHYIAIAQTGFVFTGVLPVSGPVLSNQTLALGVTVAAFLICGAFLLSGFSFIEQLSPEDTPAKETTDPGLGAGVPFEKDGRTQFALRDNIAAIRAEGHYTLLYINDEKLFCPWSITEAQTRLEPFGYIRTHRSYLINPAHVSGFERLKDTGVCFFDGVASLSKVPVARSRLGQVREVLGL